MDWYLPITILPGVGMLIFSTTNQMLAISTEVGVLLSSSCTDFQHKIADLKIKQITRLTYAATLLYFGAGTYVLSGILGATLFIGELYVDMTLIVGTLAVFVSLFLCFYW
jgi:hypothetical protein